MLTIVISLLMSLGMIDNAEDFYSLSSTEQNTLTEIIIEDLTEY